MDRSDLMNAIYDKCRQNNEKWGGPNHDDHHTRRDWIAFIVRQLGHAEARCDVIGCGGFNEQMIAIAALAVQAIESQERIAANVGKRDHR